MIKEKIVAKTFHELKDKLELKTKTNNLTYKSFKRQQYIYELQATLTRIIFKARLPLIDVKMNYKSKYVKVGNVDYAVLKRNAFATSLHVRNMEKILKKLLKDQRDWTRTVYSEKTRKTSKELLSTYQNY